MISYLKISIEKLTGSRLHAPYCDLFKQRGAILNITNNSLYRFIDLVRFVSHNKYAVIIQGFYAAGHFYFSHLSRQIYIQSSTVTIDSMHIGI